MSRLAWGERLRIVAVTATLTSAGWILFGAGIVDSVGGDLLQVRRLATPAPVAAGDSARPARFIAENGGGGERQAFPLPPELAGAFRVPVAGVRPSQLADTYADPRGGGTRSHEGIDIMAPRGTPVLAATSGTLEKLFDSQDGGLTIYVRSPDRRFVTYYAHLDSYAPGLAENQAIRRGQVLGTVGSTGDASPEAPHLHFELLDVPPEKGWWEPNRSIDPYPVLSGAGR